MKLTAKEEKIARLALDKGAKNGERQAAAIKLIESLYARGVQVEELEAGKIIHRNAPAPAYQDVPVYATPEPVPKSDWGEFLINLWTTVLIVILAPTALLVALVVLTVIAHIPGLAILAVIGGVIGVSWLIREWIVVLKNDPLTK